MTRSKAYLIAAVVAGFVIATFTFRYFWAHGVQVPKDKTEKHLEGNHKEKGFDEHERAIRLQDEDLKEFGIEVEEAGPGRLAVQLELPGEIVANPDRLAHIVPRVPGVVRQVIKNLGDFVKAGETLAILDSRELADAKAAYLASLKRIEIAEASLKREETLFKKRISPELDYLEAKKAFDEASIELKSAEQKLHTFNLSDESVARLPSQPDISYTRYEMKAPFTGVIIEKHIALGELLKDDKDAYVIADLSTVWVNIQVYQKDMLSVQEGQRVVISAGRAVPDATGKISFIEPVAGAETRTALAHAVLPNPKGLLRPGLFVVAKIAVDEVSVPVLIQKSALLSDGGKAEIFVQTEEGFKPEVITLGKSNDTHAEVTGGLEPGQKYVSRGGFTLKAQMSKGAFGDGHAH